VQLVALTLSGMGLVLLGLNSTWARRHYDAAEAARAQARADGFDARFGRWGLSIADLVAGRPSLPSPAPPATEP
jgi:hypothetical protein